jgi:hypothetical protein
MTRGLVVFEQSEREGLPSSAVFEQDWKRQFVRRVFGDQRPETMREISEYAVALKSYSPLEILCNRAVKRLRNDKIFPNPYRGQVIEAIAQWAGNPIFAVVDSKV